MSMCSGGDRSLQYFLSRILYADDSILNPLVDDNQLSKQLPIHSTLAVGGYRVNSTDTVMLL